MKREVRDVAASTHARLLALANQRGEDFNRLLERFVFERFLFRLSISDLRDQMVVKGALLFVAWPGATDRATRDIDFLSLGHSDQEEVAHRIRGICETPVPHDDGVVFDLGSITTEEIRPQASYGGIRVKLMARLGKARIPTQIDLGFGDVVVPQPVDLSFPVLLDHPAPNVRAYPVESVVAEKLESISVHGLANSRLKDYYDLWMLAETFEFDGELLVRAVSATFRRRGRSLPPLIPDGLTTSFFLDEDRPRLWRAFLDRTGITGAPQAFPEIGVALRAFLTPVFDAATGRQALIKRWRDGAWL
jgi:predicted nucleotidyltransferase component of viral defense system